MAVVEKMGQLIHSVTRKTALVLVWIIVGFAVCSYAVADESEAQWHQLSKRQQQILAPMRQDWGNLPAEKRARLVDTASRWDTLSPSQQNTMRARMQHWSKLSPEKKQSIYERQRKFESLPEQEKNKIKERYKWFQGLSPEEKKEVRKQWRKDRDK